MSGPGRIASSRLTRGSLSAGTAVSAACFLVALALDVAGRDVSAGSADPAGLLVGILGLRPWAWATLGTLAVIVTPAIGLVATAWEYRAAADRRTSLLAVAVLAVLGLSLGVALLRPA